ncbi:hypothetical protein ASG87_01425 [Frateuria sp. Soil773]|nr:hypothetical protein ASG87_01425 [Frateuria sp. Soil773]
MFASQKGPGCPGLLSSGRLGRCICEQDEQLILLEVFQTLRLFELNRVVVIIDEDFDLEFILAIADHNIPFRNIAVEVVVVIKLGARN